MNEQSPSGSKPKTIAWLHVPTGNVFKDGECQALIAVRQKQFTDIPAGEMEADFVPLVEGPALIDRIEALERALRPLADLDALLDDRDVGEFFRHDGTAIFISEIRLARTTLSGDTK